MSEGGRASVPDISDDLVRRLRAVGSAVSPGEIGDLWIFPPLADVEESAEFLLFTRHRDGDRRCVYSARVRRGGNGSGPGADAGDGPQDRDGRGRPTGNGAPGGRPGQEITHHGTVPSDRVGRLVRRFRRRLGAEDREPVHVTIDGREERWTGLLAENGGREDVDAGRDGGEADAPGRGPAPGQTEAREAEAA